MKVMKLQKMKDNFSSPSKKYYAKGLQYNIATCNEVQCMLF